VRVYCLAAYAKKVSHRLVGIAFGDKSNPLAFSLRERLL